MNDSAGGSNAPSEGESIASHENRDNAESVDRTKFHIFSFSIYSTGIISLTEEKRMSCGKCGPKAKVKAMPTKKKATKKKKK
ncbi:MAG: hypothetical protein ABSB83_04385 [Methanomassiliicoccales archaeon]|jgi:hypothetical protein